ncbi:glycosyltransferase family 2 protein [Hymenobacter jeollabukensis]|uniref:Glycosyltransferase family 2 protein n=1 Tax=Hymenobacter jeollabukensis TaxID=2025313 RepID=A0A5R8WR88_9BACT|nr:glycosyltransferase family 2 protein [Hymenobacter jeollabukensis]TLM93264.1 glycosyltransferase family 2 protein [Hymenobacter jeollabukensis]
MPTDVSILVKSFNRPYYLDRCLRSIYDHVTGSYTITVLDDGTPGRYLDEIQRRYPEVRIVRSELYDAKVAQLDAHAAGGAPFSLRIIPTKLWIEGVEQATPKFCLLEDDIWMTRPVNLSQMADYMQERQVVMTKFYWGGNINTFEARMGGRGPQVQEYELALPAGPEWWLRMLLLNKFKSHSILHRLGLAKEGIYFQLPFYSMYSVASAVFDKAYWLHLWQAGQKQADEVHQLSRALHWTKSQPTRFAKTEQEVTQTSFTSSATNMFKGVEFDVVAANYHLNEAWLQGRLDAMHDYPLDFSTEYLKPIFDQANDPRCTYPNWLRWIERFKGVYASMGVVVD